jgi:hypothetical protein
MKIIDLCPLCPPLIQLLPEPGLVIGEADDDLIVLPVDARRCPARDLLSVVVQVMQLTGGRLLLSQDGPGSPDQGGCASGDDAGGFRRTGHCLGIVRKQNPRLDQRIPVIGSGAIRKMERPFPYILKAIH